MISAVSSTTPSQPVAPATRTSTPKATQSGAPAATTDSVQISKAAQALLANLKEASETPAQTAKEAGNGDMQAKRLLAKEATADSDGK